MAVAAIVAAILRVPLLGAGPIFPVLPHGAPGGGELLVALLVGLLAGFGSWLLTTLVYAVEDFFGKLPVHWMWWPAIGAVVVGVGGWIDPRVLGVGYGTIHTLLLGQLLGTALIGLLVAKAIVWSVALGSGTSGGVLAPLLIIGGALGAFVGQWLPVGDPGLWAMVGMSAIMGGTMRSPLTGMVFMLELTHDLNAMPALFIGCVAAMGVTVLVLRRSILTEKLARRGHHITREYSVDPLELARVRDVMDRDVATIPATMKLLELSDRIAAGDANLNRRQGTLIVNAQSQLVGIITRGDIVRALRQNEADEITVLEAGSPNLEVTFPDELLHGALVKMLNRGVGRLPVVERANQTKVVGYLGRAAILSARMKMHEEENIRQKVWPWQRAGKPKSA